MSNEIACAVTLLLTPVLYAMVIGVIVSFLALPLTTSIAIVGRNLCQDCHHRFKPASESASAAGLARFPWALHVLNTLLLLLLCVVGPIILRFAAGAGNLPVLAADMGRLITCGLPLWASLGYHLVLYSRLTRRVTAPSMWAALFLLPGALGGGLVFHSSLASSDVQGFLTYAKLAPLPKSATDVRFYSWSSPFSGEDFVRFTADPNDIERFLANSPALWGQQPERFSETRKRLEYPEDSQGIAGFPQDGQHEYCIPSRNAPAWFRHVIRGPARRYLLRPPKYRVPGEVLVDDETNTVYIYASFS